MLKEHWFPMQYIKTLLYNCFLKCCYKTSHKLHIKSATVLLSTTGARDALLLGDTVTPVFVSLILNILLNLHAHLLPVFPTWCLCAPACPQKVLIISALTAYLLLWFIDASPGKGHFKWVTWGSSSQQMSALSCTFHISSKATRKPLASS